jgi:hypothetical protein
VYIINIDNPKIVTVPGFPNVAVFTVETPGILDLSVTKLKFTKDII